MRKQKCQVIQQSKFRTYMLCNYPISSKAKLKKFLVTENQPQCNLFSEKVLWAGNIAQCVKFFPTRSRSLIKIPRLTSNQAWQCMSVIPVCLQRYERWTQVINSQKIWRQLAWFIQKQIKRHSVSYKVEDEYSLCLLTSKLSQWHLLDMQIP